MKYIAKSQFKAMPWRNGGGVTHEILRDGAGEDFGWRISLAEVATSGAFSLFPRHLRLLCVVAGSGMDLRGENKCYEANLFSPVAFSGGEAIAGELRDGPCRDFNLIYDPQRWLGKMDAVFGPGHVDANGPATDLAGFYVHSGSGRIGDYIIPSGDFCFIDQSLEKMELATDSIALKIELHRL